MTKRSFLNRLICQNKEEREENTEQKPVFHKNNKMIDTTSDNKSAGVAKNAVSTGNTAEGELAADVFYSGSFVVFRSMVAGTRIEEIDVIVTRDTITVKGVRHDPDEEMPKEGFYNKELYWGVFSRKVTIPVELDIEHVEASLKAGVLTVRVLKVDKTRAEKVSIKGE